MSQVLKQLLKHQWPTTWSAPDPDGHNALEEWPHGLEGAKHPFVVWTDRKNKLHSEHKVAYLTTS